MFRAYGAFLEGWAAAECGTLGERARRHASRRREAARTERCVFGRANENCARRSGSRSGRSGRAIAILDEALATCERLGHRTFEAELHRVRGETLLNRDPANPARAEGAFLTASAVAKRQGARSFELRAALALAKVYQSTARLANAHAVLAPAFEGFAPTWKCPRSPKRGAIGGARRDRGGQSGGHAAAAADAIACLLWQRAHCRARLRGCGNDRGVRQSPRVGSRRQGRARTVGGRLRLMGRQLHARRVAINAGALSGFPR